MMPGIGVEIPLAELYVDLRRMATERPALPG